MYFILYYPIGNSVDYSSGPYSVRINAGDTKVLFSILINDDDILEGNEEFHLSFNLSLLLSRVIVTNPKQATVIIMDDDGKCIINSSINTLVVYSSNPYIIHNSNMFI